MGFAVTGNSGVGKSSFINAFLGLKPNAPGAAAVGLTETTINVKAFPHPENKHFVLYDLPGVGTQLFPRESYLQKVAFNQYDFFLLLSATRFTENDACLGQQVKEQQKKFFFVRTKIDFDMENEKEESGEDFNLKRCLLKIREDAQRNLQAKLTKQTPVRAERLKRLQRYRLILTPIYIENRPRDDDTALIAETASHVQCVLMTYPDFFSR
ncbi:T-cell-specific guanine nucleotide triphosphate-binding protein 2-like [Mya arenaria]|uniref:T-cell-specific guanine nucleotide triphosphate-binding protein 2-like n=1 Tax=Mya arenaria TaxID=6604 RepID=UPI0022E82EE2|nr:T-cell-specific guanine nucleotide triphosphate-binding protein 2-like [Mya arenaria]